MEWAWDPAYGVNLVLCIVILLLGMLGYAKNKEKWPLCIGIAFGLFGISHLMTLLSLKTDLADVLIVIRTLGYLLVIVALVLFWRQK